MMRGGVVFNTAPFIFGGTAIALAETEISTKKLGFLLLLTGEYKGRSFVKSFNVNFLDYRYYITLQQILFNFRIGTVPQVTVDVRALY
jgi:hypothetical protein